MALNKFYLCGNLRNGTVVCGFLSAFIYATMLISEISKHYLTHLANYLEKSFDVEATSMFWSFVISLAINLLLSILLVVGAVKRNHFMMLPWITYNGITLIPVALVAIVGLIFTVPIYGPIYIWWCICSTYQKVQEESTSNYKKCVSLSAFGSDKTPLDV